LWSNSSHPNRRVVDGAPRVNLAARLTDLTNDALAYLRAAAIGEGHAYHDLVRVVCGLDPFAAAFARREAAARGLLDGGPTADPIAFHHALLRDAVLDSMLSTEQKAMHRQWAELPTPCRRGATHACGSRRIGEIRRLDRSGDDIGRSTP
jgi:hypothetical protein